MIVSSVGQSSSFSGTSEWFCSSELSAWFKNGKEKERETDWHDNVQDHQHAGQYLSMPPVKKSLKHSIRTDITSKMFQKYAGSVAPPPIALCKSISRNLPSYFNGPAIWSGKNLRWDMANVEQALVSQINWLLVKHFVWYHLQGDHVPSSPESIPFLEGWDISRQWFLFVFNHNGGGKGSLKTNYVGQWVKDKCRTLDDV